MPVDYDHRSNLHTLTGPKIALPAIIGESKPQSVLDVGCGFGTWLKAFREFGIIDYFGIDGVNIAKSDFLVEFEKFKVLDFSKPWSLKRRFDLAICLEVAEHLPPTSSPTLVAALTAHSDRVIFSAACPDQPGQNHINGHWPEYWQSLFNECGFACFDDIRPKIWREKQIEVWYRQNIFSAHRSDQAGKEQRIAGMIHSEFLPIFLAAAKDNGERIGAQNASSSIKLGNLPFAEYPKMTATALVKRAKRKTGLT